MKLNSIKNQTLDTTVVGFASQQHGNETQHIAPDTVKEMVGLVRLDTTQSTKEKRRLGAIYESMKKDEFKALKVNQFQTFIDKEKLSLKIRSNPNQQYDSASNHDVFEIRERENERTGVKQVNQFIAIPEEELSEAASSDIEIVDIKPVSQPYQLKNLYQPVEKTEFELDDDDEDYLLFMPQPFDTVMNIGHSELLTHLPTKFLARRSDIIVSSTLSITLTPIAANYRPMDKALMTDEEVNKWIDKRQEFRAMKLVQIAKLPQLQ